MVEYYCIYIFMTWKPKETAPIGDTLGELKHRSGIEVVYNTSDWDINSIRQQHVLPCDSCTLCMVMQGKDTIKQSRNGNHQSPSYSLPNRMLRAARESALTCNLLLSSLSV